MSFLLSFRITSAARVIRSSEKPVAILANVPIEHGQMIIVRNFADPLANGALKFEVLEGNRHIVTGNLVARQQASES